MTATKHEGLYYRVNKRKQKVFYARFTINKKAYLKKLGQQPFMTTQTAYLARVEMIASYKGDKVVTNRTVDSFFDEYVESRRHTLSSSWYYNITKNYALHLKKQIGHKSPYDVSVVEIQKIINDMLTGNNARGKKYKPSTVKQIKDCMSGLYLFLRKSNVDVVKMGSELNIPKFDNKIYFTISDEKAQMLFDAILGYEEVKWRAFFIWLLHGPRKMSVASMRWEWLHFDKMIYVVPGPFNKSGKEIVAPMTRLLVDALERYGVCDEGYVFGSDTSGSGHVSSAGVDFQWRNIRALAGVPKMRLHDIRHLIGFMGVNSGYSLEMIGSVLGHSSTATTKRYSNMKSDSAAVVLSAMFDRFVK